MNLYRRSIRQKDASQDGQALVEFALIVLIIITLMKTVLQILPVFTARGAVLEITASGIERVTSYLSPNVRDPLMLPKPEAERNYLCGRVWDDAKNTLTSLDGLVGPLIDPKELGDNPKACADTTAASDTLAVSVMAVDSSGADAPDKNLLPGTDVRVCASFNWVPKPGLVWLFWESFSSFSNEVHDAFTFRYCGVETIETYRTR